MFRYPLYLAAYFITAFVSLFVTPVAVLFWEPRVGGLNNDGDRGIQPKLPESLSWFDTLDNSLWGDDAHKVRHPKYNSWWAMVCWLYRNPAYGFKWNVLGCPMGDTPVIKRKEWLYTKGWYFQLYLTSHIKFGWILDAYYERTNPEPEAVFVFWC